MEKIFGKEIKRRDFFKAAGIGIGVLGAATMGFPNIVRSAEKWRFKFATFEPANSFLHNAFWHYWCDKVTELSKGAVAFDKYPGQTLVKAQECYEAVRDGITETGIISIPYEAGTISLPTIKELPFSFKNYGTHYLMWRKCMDAGLQDYYHSFGVHVVADQTLPIYSFWTSKKWGPIRRLEDLKGCKIRSPGGYMSEACKAMGAVPVNIPSPEAYTAMERGTLDCLTMPEPSNFAFRLQEVTGYICRPYYATTGVPIIVNLKVWNSLPKDIQYIMLQAGGYAEDNQVKEELIFNEKVLEPTIKKAGIEVVPLPEKEKERMRKACAPVWDKWLAENGEKFGGLGNRMFDIVVQHVGRP